ncbi:unnamed protein product [Linum tenue]|uniref:Uncharacterized protein n=1 Tax=Linum tenue TaxID=586396 RepID=A0AAV0Q5Z2_9ROSI|nr:unnamed protein product [Linum tenue]CAI0481349.1 unnamed protein product [Linum tenue]CAI0539682.1 unnamed protein product [Linum tenue]
MGKHDPSPNPTSPAATEVTELDHGIWAIRSLVLALRFSAPEIRQRARGKG